ncbi:bacterio-opsin activator domain-containing protein [Halomarina salina]|uniref:Bacterio-opsin activator domain-containing protein n=1 Tax=Halomarina salina TaxID=1872699 RepID=A0ABD5RND1_9EURY|nr:bacterio-opsin activator domain-containing protein [Halomarina salina]
MDRPIHVAVRGAPSDALLTTLDAEYGIAVVEDDDAVACTLVTDDALDDVGTRDDQGEAATGAHERPLDTTGHERGPLVALCSEPSGQATALTAGADRCVTLAGDAATDAASVAAVVDRVLADEPTERDLLIRESLDALTDFFFLFDTEMRLLVWNDAVTAVTGYTDEELDEMNPLNLISEEDVVEVATAVQRAIQQGSATEEGDVLTKDGDRIPYEFTGTALTDDDGEAIGVCGIGRNVSEREQRERTLERQAESLRTLNRINEVIRNVNHDLVRAQTREDIEHAVVERLADESTYRFAWVGEYDAGSERVTPCAWSGEGEAYLDAREDDGSRRETLATKAIRDGSMQVAPHLAERPSEPWVDAAVDNGFAAATAVPLVYRGVTYGVLCVYSDRPDAFEGTERAVFGELGETVAYAIGAAERHRALVADTVVELELLVGEIDGIPSAASAVDSTVTFRGAAPTDDGSPSQFYRIEGDLEGVVETLPDDIDVSVVRDDEEGGVVRVEGDTSFSSLLADYGGTMRRVHVEDGGFRLVATFPQGTDVRNVLEAVRDRLPAAELVARRERERNEDDAPDVALTDRQRTVLTTAFHLGFFDSPRVNTGGEVAEELGISTPTFHEHIRIAERKLVEAFLGTPEDTNGRF